MGCRRAAADRHETQGGLGNYPIDGQRGLAVEVDGKKLGLLLLEGVAKN